MIIVREGHVAVVGKEDAVGRHVIDIYLTEQCADIAIKRYRHCNCIHGVIEISWKCVRKQDHGD